MITLTLDWREVLWWMQGGMSGSHNCWDVYKDMVNRVWPQCSEQERRNIHYVMGRDFGTYWRNSDGEWKPESEIFDKTPWMYFRQVLARFDPENQYAVTMRYPDCNTLERILQTTPKASVISTPKPSKVRGYPMPLQPFIIRAYKWQDEYRIDWDRLCDESQITKVERLTIPDDGTM